jgi:hypothetical protein
MCVTTEVPALQGEWKKLRNKDNASESKPYISRMECVQSAGAFLIYFIIFYHFFYFRYNFFLLATIQISFFGYYTNFFFWLLYKYRFIGYYTNTVLLAIIQMPFYWLLHKFLSVDMLEFILVDFITISIYINFLF